MSGFEIGKLTIPIFIGTLLNWAFLGTLFVQVYLYFIAFPQDRRLNKVIVAFVFIAEIVQTFSDCKNTINAFGAGWGNRESLDHVGWAWFSVPVLGSTIASVGQVFFAWRISIIGHTLFIPALIVAIAMIQFGAGIWTGVEIVRAGKFSLLDFNRLKPPVAWLASTAACDLIIVAATVFFIMKARQTEFKFSNATNIAISRIIKVSVETGLLCAVFAVVDLYLYVAYDGNNYHLATCIWLSKVYSNSIMVILNSRAYIGHAAPQDATRAQITDMVFQSHMSPPTAVHVSVDRESTANSSHAQVDSGKIYAGIAV
ncbi:hypothetical protein B0H13DRAFT_1988434 [Mycena leptocephala]|nr:hypothetical protein B0H13DRAFT_1988434 [Mycena leptocephala]